MNWRGWWDGPADENDPAGDRGHLVLIGTRVLGWSAGDDELAIDIYGGEGTWRAYHGLSLHEEGTVDGMMMLTLRAGGRAALDLDLLAHLTRWANDGTALDVTVEVEGTNLSAPGRRWTIGDQRETITLSSAR